jgi:RNA polymerase sigma-70 factor (ECF subfamily)
MARFTDIVLPDGLAVAARAGDADALGAVYEACAGATYTLIRRLVRRDAVAEDLLQETFADVIRNVARWEGRAPLPMWIRAIAVRRSLMHLRSPWTRSLEWLELLPGAEPAEPGHDARCDQERDLEHALMTLPPLSRAVVWLHDVEGYTHEEIAAQLGRTPSFSKSQLSRAHARLRQALRDDPPPVAEPAAEEGTCRTATTN